MPHTFICRQCGTPFVSGDMRRKLCSRACYYDSRLKPRDTMKDRFERKFYVTPGCWVWSASKSDRGYGIFIFDKQRFLAPRAAYELYAGSIPEGLCVCHRCDNPACVNPDHLFLGTHADNMADKAKKGRSERGEKCFLSKLTEAQVRALRADTRSPAEVASSFSIAVSTVYKIKSRYLWKHI